MMLFLYTLGVQAYFAVIRIAALFSGKARLWVQGRKDWRAALAKAYQPGGQTLWMHCASLGEFEQGRSVLEAIKNRWPEMRIVVTFFSPSGYEVRKNYTVADHVCYLPPDSPRNAADFLNLVQPTLAVFVKYELWWHYLRALQREGIPVALVSANVRRPPLPLRPFYKQLYGLLDYIFVQHTDNAQVVRTIFGFDNVAVSGDTRFDRVAQIAAEARPLPDIEKFVNGRLCFVAGSTWPSDEKLLQQAFKQFEAQGKRPYVLIIVPHETDLDSVNAIAQQWGNQAVRYTEIETTDAHHNVLIVDRVGLLSRIYRYAGWVWVGGGFDYGIHNTLEAAVYGKKVFFGTKYGKFREAVDLIALGAAQCITQTDALAQALNEAYAQTAAYLEACKAAGQYVQRNTGATDVIVEKLKELGYLPA
jgi:3-deoxy-D-manno-octulosonic-acid transferase